MLGLVKCFPVILDAELMYLSMAPKVELGPWRIQFYTIHSHDYESLLVGSLTITCLGTCVYIPFPYTSITVSSFDTSSEFQTLSP